MAAYNDNIILKKDGLTVTIATDPTDEENLTKGLILINPPKGTGTQESNPSDPDYGPNTTRIIDLLSKVEQRMTIDGSLVTGMSAGDSSNTARGKKSDLKKIFLGGGTITLTYEGSDITINMDKLSIKRLDTGGQYDRDELAEFSIKLTCIRGEDF